MHVHYYVVLTVYFCMYMCSSYCVFLAQKFVNTCNSALDQRTGEVPPPHMMVIPPGWYSPEAQNFNDPKHITKDKLLPKGHGFCRCEEYHLGKTMMSSGKSSLALFPRPLKLYMYMYFVCWCCRVCVEGEQVLYSVSH